MDCTCVRQTELPNTTRLYADYVYNPERLRGFYPRPEHDLAAVEEAAREAARMPGERRAALVEALRPLNEGSRALETLARPGTVAVVTGQQVGLFSGPCYTIYKALTAVRLARELSGTGIPAVPVFWLATEDHDFAEVDHCHVFDEARRPLRLEARAETRSQPVGGVALPSPPLEELGRALHALPFGAEVAGTVAEAYTPGRNMGRAFSDVLKRLLRNFDLIHVDPMAPAVRELAAPALRRAVEAAPELGAALLERSRELVRAGYHAQVHVEERTSLVFLLEGGRRLGLARRGSDYLLNGRRYASAELAENAHKLSPNALLRPVVQDSMLPTAAYVGGPAELAYLAQSEVLYRQLVGRMPVAVPRSGFTLLDARGGKLMARFGLRLGDFFRGREALRERIASQLVPAGLKRTLEETRGAVAGAVERLAAEVEALDPTIAAATRKSRAKMLYQLAKSEGKIGREMLARDERSGRDADYLYNLVYPGRQLQERLYSILPFLAVHGPDLPDAVYEHVSLNCPDHQVLRV